MKASTDVVVIGGGPTGSTMATFLAKAGHRVTVLERERFPREHVGESLLPFCYEIFEELGVLDEMKARFVRKPGVRFLAPDGTRDTTWCFKHVIDDPSYLSFHVLRAEFDELLLDNSAAHGATVHEATRVTDVNLEGPDGGVVVSAVGPRGGEQTHHARIVVDASGRDTFLATRMKTKVPHEKLDRAALSTHWQGAKYAGGINEGLLQVLYLGGADKLGWIWAIPVGTDRVSVGVVLNHAYMRAGRQRVEAAGSKDWMRDFYKEELFSSPFMSEVLADARIVMPMMFNGDYSYAVERKWGPNFVICGDASAFIDPIFASGVHLSMNSARLLSRALHTKLTTGAEAGDAAIADTYVGINGAYGLVDRLIRLFYTPSALTWAELGSATDLLHHHYENAYSVLHYLLAGDFFERYERYHHFLDLLEDPKMGRRFRKTMVDRSEYRTAACETDRDDVFSPLMEEHEQRRDKILRSMTL